MHCAGMYKTVLEMDLDSKGHLREWLANYTLMIGRKEAMEILRTDERYVVKPVGNPLESCWKPIGILLETYWNLVGNLLGYLRNSTYISLA
jgi:hypothetical protein